MKKILILSCKIGHGHMSPAQAVKQALEQLYLGKYDVEIIDFFELVNKKINAITKKALYGSIKHAPYIYKALYERFDKKRNMKALNILQYPLVYRKIKKFLSKKNPDLILSVYPIWDYNIVRINNKNHRPIPFISLITDSIEVHHAWTIADADYNIVANKDTAKEVSKMGIPKSKIKNLGLPIRLQFLEEVKKDKVFKEFKLTKGQPLLLFTPSAENTRKMMSQIREIATQHPDKNCVVITGGNKKAFNKLQKTDLPKNIKVLGFTKKMHKLIKSADLMIGKAGGSMVQECIACQVPILISQVIPGHEEGNAILVRRHKLGIDITHSKISLADAITRILKNKQKYKANIKKLSRPKAALKVAKFLDSLT